jgi:hypothetical protein
MGHSLDHTDMTRRFLLVEQFSHFRTRVSQQFCIQAVNTLSFPSGDDLSPAYEVHRSGFQACGRTRVPE